MPKLDVGSGERKRQGYESLDQEPKTKPDHLWNMEITPWKFSLNYIIPDNYYDEIRAHHILEHIKTQYKTAVMYEMWRILRRGGILDIAVPEFPDPKCVQDPTHVSFWCRESFWYYEAGNLHRKAMLTRDNQPIPSFKEISSHSFDGILKISLAAVKPVPHP